MIRNPRKMCVRQGDQEIMRDLSVDHDWEDQPMNDDQVSFDQIMHNPHARHAWYAGHENSLAELFDDLGEL